MSEEVKIINKGNNVALQKTTQDEDNNIDKILEYVSELFAEQNNKIKRTLELFASFFAVFGVIAICYKMYLANWVWEAWVEAAVTLAQLLTITVVVFSGIITLSKNLKREVAFNKKFYKKNLRNYCKKYDGLIDYTKKDKDEGRNIVFWMLSDHTNWLDFLLNKKVDNNLKIAVFPEEINGNKQKQIKLYLQNSYLDKYDKNPKSIEKILQKITDVLNYKFKYIMNKDVEICANAKIIDEISKRRENKLKANAIEFSKKTGNVSIIHIYIDPDKLDNKGMKMLADILDFWVMANLAIA